MTRSYVHLPRQTTVEAPNGGLIRSAGDDVYSPAELYCTPTGVAFGPLYVGVPDGGGMCSLDRVDFLPTESDGDGGVLFFGITAGGAGSAASSRSDRREELQDLDASGSTRREILTFAGVVAAALAAGPITASGQEDDLAALHIAEVNITTLNAPVTFRVLDVVDEVLPTTTEILVDAENSRVGEITDPGTGVTLPADTTGTVRIYLRDSEGNLSRLLSWARGLVGGDEEITYERELPKPATEYQEGQFIKLSEHPALVDPVVESGAGGTVLQVGNTTIPHSDDEASEAGSYGVFDDALVYEIGPNPPASAKWSLRTRLGYLAALSERYI